MDTYAKLFSKAALVYLALGTILGVTLGMNDDWGVRLRFVHIHFNLLGFMVMMIAGVAYHVLPRFNARPVPWPEGVKYHFILQNVGLVGMCATHVAMGFWSADILNFIFILFAFSAGAGLLIMCYNLYSVLRPENESETVTQITKDMKVAEILSRFPQATQIFIDEGFSALANPVARQTFAKVVTLEKACEKHGIDTEAFLKKLNDSFSSQVRPPASPANQKEGDVSASVGIAIQKGEYCGLNVRVGSLLDAYPETRPVFEKYYGEGCFSCPGQVFETVLQTAEMHNVNPEAILKDINSAVDAVLKS
jgi:phage shock protein PspC (stress-responsive transcriptional regulator)